MSAMGPGGLLLMLLLGLLGVCLAVVLLVLIAIPLVRGVAWTVGGFFKAIGWFIGHIFSYITGTIGDALRVVGAVLTMLVLLPLAPANVILGRWSAAGHFVNAFKRECTVAGLAIYRMLLQRPLKLFLLHGVLEGVEQRVPEAFAAAPTSDTPNRRTGQYDGYTIVGSLRGGGSGGKLYIAEPSPEKQQRGMPPRVVIKSFALSEGSSLPQIVRESRALEAAKSIGLVLDHQMDEHRFYYVMPYHPGDHLGIATRQLHAESGENGLTPKQINAALAYTTDLLSTLAMYHRAGLWHKDVKPENVIIHSGRAHLVDLGLVTQLRSAMTLTTHGTEYFRDPEMVRQALRGVKVHQIDCTKFDIYAAGAVLYFVLENTFPAHGGLSRFSRRSPEALRWIVRRAMADYNKRYESTEQMLADVMVVMRAHDPYAVKPAELPSMGGGEGAEHRQAVAEPSIMDEINDAINEAVAGVNTAVASLYGAGTPTPPPVDGSDVDYASVSGAAAAGGSYQRPKLRVTNWWTGEYEVEDVSAPDGEWKAAARALRHEHQAHKVRGGSRSRSARKAAKAQVKSARARAREIRRNAQRHRRAVAERQPSASLIVVTLLFLAVLGALLLLPAAFFFSTESATRVWNNNGDSGGASGATTSASVATATSSRRTILLINDHPNADDPRVQRHVEDIVRDYKQTGFNVVTDDSAMVDTIRDLFHQWQANPQELSDGPLEDAWEKHGLFGVLHVTRKPGSGLPADDTSVMLVRSARPGAAKREFNPQPISQAQMVAAPPADGAALLLIVDHPQKRDEAVQREMKTITESYTEAGWTIDTDFEIESKVRSMLTSAMVELEQPLTPRIVEPLEHAGFAGILFLSNATERGPPEQRVSHHLLITKQQP